MYIVLVAASASKTKFTMVVEMLKVGEVGREKRHDRDLRYAMVTAM